MGLDTLACSSTGNLAGAVAARAAAEGMAAAVFCPLGLEREKLSPVAAYGATLYEVRGSYDDCSRLTVELSFELPWGFVNVGLRSYYAEGSKTVAFEIAEQLGWTAPDVVVCPVASGSLLSKVAQGFAEFRELGLDRRARAAHRRRAGGGLQPGCGGLRRGAPGDARPAPDVRRRRSRSAIPRTATTRSRPSTPREAPFTPCRRTRSRRT